MNKSNDKTHLCLTFLFKNVLINCKEQLFDLLGSWDNYVFHNEARYWCALSGKKQEFKCWFLSQAVFPHREDCTIIPTAIVYSLTLYYKHKNEQLFKWNMIWTQGHATVYLLDCLIKPTINNNLISNRSKFWD